jgi:hypothetical protein
VSSSFGIVLDYDTSRWLVLLVASVDTLRGGRYTTPGPSVTCVDPKLTVLWPSPPASPSEEEASIDGACTASEDWPQDLVDAHFRGTHAEVLTRQHPTHSSLPLYSSRGDVTPGFGC